MKVIDLLNKIANGEEVPNRIMYNEVVWEYEKNLYDYRSRHNAELLFSDEIVPNWVTTHLNTEVEILDDEEDNPKTLKFGDEIILTRTNCDDIQGFIISAKGIESIEDKDIPLIPDDELWIINKRKGISDDCKYGIDGDTALNHNFKVLKEKINQLVEEFNNHIKENK